MVEFSTFLRSSASTETVMLNSFFASVISDSASVSRQIVSPSLSVIKRVSFESVSAACAAYDDLIEPLMLT